MSFLGFLTGAASLFSGGGETDTQNQNMQQTTLSDQQDLESLTSTQNQTSNQNQVGSGQSVSQGQQTQTGQQTGTQVGTQQSSTTQNTVGTQTNYSSSVMSSLDSLANQILRSGATQQSTDVLKSRLEQIRQQASQPQFDVQGYVSGIARQAQAATQTNLDSRINSTLSATGGSESGNSMAALLGNRIRTEEAANLAGIVSNAQATGEGIRRAGQESLTQQISGLSNDISGSLNNLLASTKGGRTATTQATRQATQSKEKVKTKTNNKQKTNNKERLRKKEKLKTKETTRNKTKQDRLRRTKNKQFTDQTTNTFTERGKKGFLDNLFGKVSISNSKA